MKKTSEILKIGVTGGIGSGKTAVCELFKRFGIPVLSADEIANEASQSDLEIQNRITKLIGSQAYDEQGLYNRSLVASKIFSDRKLKRQLEQILHPRVQAKIQAQLLKLAQDRHPIAIVEAALIYEAKLDTILDIVVAVDADEPVRVQRVQVRDAASRESIEARMKSQMDTKKKLAKADYVIHNNKSLEELETSVQFLYSVFTKLIHKE